MQTATNEMWNLWQNGGPFLGDDGAPHSRVTVEKSFFLNTTGNVVGSYNKGPVRWFQRKNNSQVETEVPNIKSIQIDRTLDQDAATCQIVMYNTTIDLREQVIEADEEYNNAVAAGADAGTLAALQAERTLLAQQLAQFSPYQDTIGQPGYFSQGRGITPEAINRWGTRANSWAGILVPNALIRTYQGYGGRSKTIAQALTDGNLIQTGTWLVDEVDISTDGTILLKCRDMAKLLIRQQVYPPLVPERFYKPLEYCRFVPSNNKVPPAFGFVYAPGGFAARRFALNKASSDAWYGVGGEVHGHTPAMAVDGNADSYALSVGNANPQLPFAVEYWEGDVGEQINSVFIWPYAGNYNCYVSVMENGVWQGAGTIPYNPAGVGRYGLGTAYQASIPFVTQFGVPWETAAPYTLPRTYQAQKVRFTFTSLQYTDWGPFRYRAGVRELGVGTTGPPELIGLEFAIGICESGTTDAGYLIQDTSGDLFAFGNANRYGTVTSTINTGISATPTGQGYYIWNPFKVLGKGGDAQNFNYTDAAIGGNAVTDLKCVCVTKENLGFWVLRGNGNVYAFGNAVWHGNNTTGHEASWLEKDPSGNGYWILDVAGNVSTFGGAVYYGNPVPDSDQKIMRSSPTGHGYWCVGRNGRVQVFGDAFGQSGPLSGPGTLFGPNAGDAVGFVPRHHNDGYWVLLSTGIVFNVGSAPVLGDLTQKKQTSFKADGNYTDYTDIVRDLLLWSGWWLQTASPVGKPEVYGNIESTGSYAEECLTEENIDKQPVINVITTLKQTVGYIFWVDEAGGAHFEHPNFWSSGNFINETGKYTAFIPDIDEQHQLTTYVEAFKDTTAFSEVIVSTDDLYQGFKNTVTTRDSFPAISKLLKGIVAPFVWTNEMFSNPTEQKRMAELIAIHAFWGSRLGQVTIPAMPALQLNDQVRIWERQTNETFVHYVQGISMNHNLESGEFTMTLTTHWLGDGTPDGWGLELPRKSTSGSLAATANAQTRALTSGVERFIVSERVKQWLQNVETRVAAIARLQTDTTPQLTQASKDQPTP